MTRPNVERQIRLMFWLMFATISVWLGCSIYFVNIEFDDGYSTIVNSQAMLGISEAYFWQRGPLFAIILMPAEAVANFLGLHPLNVRPHHLLFSIIHLAYLIAVWKLLTKEYGERPVTLLAYVAAIPTLLFFGYAPFISHDIVQGGVTLYMVKLANDYAIAPNWRAWIVMVIIGAALALSKQSYALVWVAILVAQLAAAMFWESSHRRFPWRILFLLTLAALASAIVTWIGFSLTPAGPFADSPWWLRPWLQIQGITEHANMTGAGAFYPWLYLRNLSAYGILAMTLILPGLVCAFSGTSLLAKRVAVVWLTLFVVLHLVEYKEVRYLGFLAPLTAFIIVPALDALIRFRKLYGYALLLIWCFDAYAIAGEAFRIRAPYYQSEVQDFFDILPAAENLTAQVIFGLPLSFVSPERNAFYRDRYHRATHLGADQVRSLYSYPRERVGLVERGLQLDQYRLPPGTIVMLASDVATRRPPFRSDNALYADSYFTQIAAITEMVTLRRSGDDYELLDTGTQPISFLPAVGSTGRSLSAADRFPVDALLNTLGLDQAPAEMSLIGLRIKHLCTVTGCQ